MIKLTYKEVKDNGVVETIARMKDDVLPGKISWKLMKIHRRLKKEVELLEEQLRLEHLKYVVQDAKGEPVPLAEVKDENGRIIKPAALWQYVEGGKELHEKAAKELINVELVVPDQEPIDIQFFLDRDIPLAHLVGLEPISADYQKERASADAPPKLEAVKNA